MAAPGIPHTSPATRAQHEWVRQVLEVDPERDPVQGVAGPSERTRLTMLVKELAKHSGDAPGPRAALLADAKRAQAALKSGDNAGAKAATDRLEAELHGPLAGPSGPVKASVGATGAPGTGEAATPNGPVQVGKGSNPFLAPKALVEIDKLALIPLRALALAQAGHAGASYQLAIDNVRRNNTKRISAKKEANEKQVDLLISIALIPAGPLIEAAAKVLTGEKILGAITEGIVKNAGAIQQKFGSKVVNGTFDALTSDMAKAVADRLDSGSAKRALDLGTGTIQARTVKFVASSDEQTCIDSFLDGLSKEANDSMSNLLDVVGTAPTSSAAAAYYNLFKTSMLAVYEAEVGLSVDHMLKQLKDVLATQGKPNIDSVGQTGAVSTSTEEVVTVEFANGRKLLAHVVKLENTYMRAPIWSFRAWITPDMQATAFAQMKGSIKYEQLSQERKVPPPNCEPGKRVVMVKRGANESLMLIDIEDEGIFWLSYGVRRFVRFPSDKQDEAVMRAMGATQLGGIDTIDIGSVKGVP